MLHSIWLPTGLRPCLLRVLTWLHCCNSYSPNYIISQFSPHTCYSVSFPHLTLLHCFLFVYFSTSSICLTSSSALLSHLVLSPHPPAPVIPKLVEEESGGWQQGAVGTRDAAFLPHSPKGWIGSFWTPPFWKVDILWDSGGLGWIIGDLPPLPSTSLPLQHSYPPPPPLLSAPCFSPSPSASHPLSSPPHPLPALISKALCLTSWLVGTSHLPGCHSVGPGSEESPGGQGPRGLRGWLGSRLEELFFTPCPPGSGAPHSFHPPSRSIVPRAPSHRKSAPRLAVQMRTLSPRTELGYSGSPTLRDRAAPPGLWPPRGLWELSPGLVESCSHVKQEGWEAFGDNLRSRRRGSGSVLGG